MPPINVLLIGSGGREHALAWKLKASPLLGRLYAAPGNPGIAQHAECIDVNVADHSMVIEFCREREIGLVVIGPEAPLVAGIVDDLSAAGIRAFGPTKAAAELEGSKAFTKELCARYAIPTASYITVTSKAEGLKHIDRAGVPIVIKADGLAGGKGVTVAFTKDEAVAANNAIFANSTRAKVVIEEYLEGEEASFFALVDGAYALPLATAQDHKRVGDADTGPNTGGMGAYSPAPILTETMCALVTRQIIDPTVRAMRDLGAPFRGILYAGLMITREGPKLIEYNVRFGDPECQALMQRLKDDLLPLLVAAADGELGRPSLHWSQQPSLTVVMAAKGYPGEIMRGTEIGGIEAAEQMEGVQVFHAGTALKNGRLIANGGRVLNITAQGDSVAQAQARAYRAIEHIRWPEGFCRRDIGWRAVERERSLISRTHKSSGSP